MAASPVKLARSTVWCQFRTFDRRFASDWALGLTAVHFGFTRATKQPEALALPSYEYSDQRGMPKHTWEAWELFSLELFAHFSQPSWACVDQLSEVQRHRASASHFSFWKSASWIIGLIKNNVEEALQIPGFLPVSNCLYRLARHYRWFREVATQWVEHISFKFTYI
jgi:hypothetical protein